MKFTYTMIVGALLGTITQQDLVSAVKLNHRHHHKHHSKHHHQLPTNRGVRFIGVTAENMGLLGGSSAVTGDIAAVVEEAAPETEATKIAEEAAVAKTVKAKEEVKSIEATIKKASEETAPPPKEPTDEEVAAQKPVETKEEYKELKAEVKGLKAKLDAEPEPATEEEAKANEEKMINQLNDKAEADRNANKVALDEKEIANLESDKRMAQKLLENPEEPATLEDAAEAKMKIKKDEKEILKVKEDLAEAQTKMVEDKKKEAERTAEAAAADQAENAEKAELAMKQAKLKKFEDEKSEADRKVTQEFEAALPEYVPKGAALPESKKLKEAEAKIEKMHAEDEKKEEERKKEIEEKKEEVGPNPAIAAMEAAQAEFDQQKELQKQASTAVVEKKKVELKEEVKSEAQEKAVVNKGPMTGEEWTASMPSYIVGAAPYKIPNKTEKAITAKAMSMSSAIGGF